MYNTSYVRGMLLYLQQQCGLPIAPIPDVGGTPKPFVLIIDEINRGSISRIFGELISLVEPSKRAGLPEALEVTLPYSKTRFSVPANLHIIATMNTADRSLAGMDIALRRRFQFIEMPPQPKLLDNVFVGELCVGELLRVMNERIELVLDREHCLGHATFMPLALKKDPSLERLAEIFKTCVLPLLQEYFFEDWQRIQWVLNDHRKPAALQFVCKPKTNLESLFGTGVSVNEQSQRWVVNDAAFLEPDAYASIVDVGRIQSP
jgi:5-methylcytosine-specific restriction enzyme B